VTPFDSGRPHLAAAEVLSEVEGYDEEQRKVLEPYGRLEAPSPPTQIQSEQERSPSCHPEERIESP